MSEHEHEWEYHENRLVKDNEPHIILDYDAQICCKHKHCGESMSWIDVEAILNQHATLQAENERLTRWQSAVRSKVPQFMTDEIDYETYGKCFD